MLDGVFKVSDAVLNLSNHGLSEVSDLFLHGRFHLMEFVPELFFDLWHIAPCVHPIGLNICYFLLVFVLDFLLSLDVLFKIGFFWALNDHSRHLLRCLHLMHGHILLEPLLDDF